MATSRSLAEPGIAVVEAVPQDPIASQNESHAGNRAGALGELATNGEDAKLRSIGAYRCTVSFDDSGGCRHSIEVYATTGYEAAAMGFKAIRNQGVMNDEHAFTITVEIQTKTMRQ